VLSENTFEIFDSVWYGYDSITIGTDGYRLNAGINQYPYLFIDVLYIKIDRYRNEIEIRAISMISKDISYKKLGIVHNKFSKLVDLFLDKYSLVKKHRDEILGI
jgi:hypothetical protein